MARYNSIMDALNAKIDDYIERGILDKSAKSSTIQECLNKIVRLSLDDMNNPEACGALIEKIKNSDMVISDQLALVLEAYDNSIGSINGKDYDVRFIGMNGDIIYGYSKDEFLALSQMPPNPKVEWFTSQGWNWDFEDAQEYVSKYGKLNVGQMYIPSDGKTHMVLDVAPRLTIPLMIQQTVSEGVTINWGDGSEEETIEGTGTVTTSHTYESEGEYEITLDVADGCTLDFGGTVNNTACNVFGESTTRLYISSLKKLFVGNGVTSIGQSAFVNCFALTILNIPDNVTSIGQSAFVNCFALTILNIPDNVTSIEDYSFRYCYSLTTISISNSVTSIGQSAFGGCYFITNLVIPDSITSIGQSAFGSCYSNTSLTIPDSITSISPYVFSNCYSLKSLTILDTVTTIGAGAFYDCYILTSLTMHENISSIEAQAFAFCNSLVTLTILSETPPTLANVNAFNGMPTDCTIYVPYGKGDTYKAASGWSTWASQIQELPEPN